MKDYAAIANTIGAFPDVESKNSTGPSSTDGTPIQKVLVDDLWGVAQAIMDRAGFVPNGNDEGAGTSQRLNALNRLYEQQTVSYQATNEQIASGLFSASGAGAPIAHPWSSGNEIFLGATAEIPDLEVGFDADGNRQLLILEATNNRIHKYDPDTLLEIDNSGSLLAAGFPAGTWEATSFCSDGTFVYVTFTDTALSPNQPSRVCCYRISDYSVRSGWNAAGTLLSGTGTTGLAQTIIADADHIVVYKIYHITGSAGILASLLRTTGALVAEGDGDAPAGILANRPLSGIASNGSVVVFTGATSTPRYYCAATIPALGDPGFATTPKSITGEAGPVICDGDLFWVFSFTPGASLRVFNPSLDTSIPFAVDKISAARACFDGVNAWLADLENTDSGADQYLGVTRFPLREYPGDTETGSAIFNPDPYISSITNPAELGGFTFTQNIGRMKFDGRDIWIAVNREASLTGSGYVRRIPRAMLV